MDPLAEYLLAARDSDDNLLPVSNGMQPCTGPWLAVNTGAVLGQCEQSAGRVHYRGRLHSGPQSTVG